MPWMEGLGEQAERSTSLKCMTEIAVVLSTENQTHMAHSCFTSMLVIVHGSGITLQVMLY